MIETFEIHASRVQLILLACCYCIASLVIFTYVDDVIIQVSGTILCVLLGLSECDRLRNEKIIQLRLNPADNSIVLEQGGQPYFFGKNKVYRTRWFAILRLVGKAENRTLFLNSDRFKTVQHYQAIRYSLLQMEPVVNVA